MNFSDSSSFEVVIHAPFGRDGSAASEVLSAHGIRAVAAVTFADLCERLRLPTGALLISEEALTVQNLEALRDMLSKHEAWSILPVILMTSQKERALSTQLVLDALATGSSISLLERPFRIVTLVSILKVALQSRQRQYQIRDLLSEQSLAVERQTNAVKQRDEFLSMASHELKTPLTSMKLQMQMKKRLLSRGDNSVLTPEKYVALLDFTETQLGRLLRLVEDMLDISRIVNGKLSLSCQDAELGDLVQEVLETFEDQFSLAGVATEFRVRERAVGNWDRYRIEQVIANLLSNAVKYGLGRPVIIEVGVENGYAFMTVADHGAGISSDNLERIFQQFERAADSSSVSGLGLGLFISRQIMDLHSGKIQVESTVGKGSVFKIMLPLSVEKDIAHAS